MGRGDQRSKRKNSDRAYARNTRTRILSTENHTTRYHASPKGYTKNIDPKTIPSTESIIPLLPYKPVLEPPAEEQFTGDIDDDISPEENVHDSTELEEDQTQVSLVIYPNSLLTHWSRHGIS